MLEKYRGPKTTTSLVTFLLFIAIATFLLILTFTVHGINEVSFPSNLNDIYCILLTVTLGFYFSKFVIGWVSIQNLPFSDSIMVGFHCFGTQREIRMILKLFLSNNYQMSEFFLRWCYIQEWGCIQVDIVIAKKFVLREF